MRLPRTMANAADMERFIEAETRVFRGEMNRRINERGRVQCMHDDLSRIERYAGTVPPEDMRVIAERMQALASRMLQNAAAPKG